MTKLKYLQICMDQDINWLKKCALNPSVYMSSTHLAIVKIAIRRKQ